MARRKISNTKRRALKSRRSSIHKRRYKDNPDYQLKTVLSKNGNKVRRWVKVDRKTGEIIDKRYKVAGKIKDKNVKQTSKKPNNKTKGEFDDDTFDGLTVGKETTILDEYQILDRDGSVLFETKDPKGTLALIKKQAKLQPEAWSKFRAGRKGSKGSQLGKLPEVKVPNSTSSLPKTSTAAKASLKKTKAMTRKLEDLESVKEGYGSSVNPIFEKSSKAIKADYISVNKILGKEATLDDFVNNAGLLKNKLGAAKYERLLIAKYQGTSLNDLKPSTYTRIKQSLGSSTDRFDYPADKMFRESLKKQYKNGKITVTRASDNTDLKTMGASWTASDDIADSFRNRGGRRLLTAEVDIDDVYIAAARSSGATEWEIYVPDNNKLKNFNIHYD